MSENFFFDYLLRLEDQSLLKGLDFFIHLVDIGVGSFEVSTAMHIQGVFKLFRKCFNL